MAEGEVKVADAGVDSESEGEEYGVPFAEAGKWSQDAASNTS